MTLTEAAHWTKKLSWFVVAGFILFVVLVIFLINNSRPQQLPQYMFPDFACTPTRDEFLRHKLEIESIQYTLETSENAFTLGTQTGRIDQLPDIINVFQYDNPGQYLTVQDDAKKLAEELGFDPNAMQRIGTTAYRWADSFHRTLTVQARNFTFDLTFDFSKRDTRPEGNLPTDEQAKQIARDFLTNSNLLYRDYSQNTPANIDITLNSDGSFRQGKYKQETNLIRVDFMRQASMITIPSNVVGAEEAKVVLERKGHKSTEDEMSTPEGRVTFYKFNTLITTLDPLKSNISVFVGPRHETLKGRAINQIYGIEYKNWIIQPEHCGTYKLINPNQAINHVINGEASLVFLNEKDGDDVLQDSTKNVRNFTIKDINIFYYDAPHEQEFLQPVYAITGDATFTTGAVGSFMFYYPAIDYDFIQDSKIE